VISFNKSLRHYRAAAAAIDGKEDPERNYPDSLVDDLD
jgi:hypothetical protein